MRMPGETAEELNNVETAWRLLAPWGLTPDNCIVERHALYTFQARWADAWRRGRLLLAGDSAHLMPPFAGQGMCSGIRDAANLSWKLDLVLRGLAPSNLLDTYSSERGAHVQHAIGMSVELGKVICVTDPHEAAERDAFMIGEGADPARILPPLPPPTLTDGLVHRDAHGAPVAGAGELTPQQRVTVAGRTGLLDEVVGLGFVLLSLGDPRQHLDGDQMAFLGALGTHVVDIDVSDQEHLAGPGRAAALIRPDHYLFGAVATIGELPGLVSDLRRQIGMSETAGFVKQSLRVAESVFAFA